MLRKRILIADDEEDVRMIVRMALGDYSISEAADGEEAWQKFTEASPSFDLVIMDLSMPRLDGGELLQRIRARDLNCRIILLTGRLDWKDRSQPLVRVINKPFDNARLSEAVAELLAARP